MKFKYLITTALLSAFCLPGSALWAGLEDGITQPEEGRQPPAPASATLAQADQPAEAALEEHAPPEAVIPPPPPHMPAAQPSSWFGLVANVASLGLYGYFTAPMAPVEPPIAQGGAAAASALEENEPSARAQDASQPRTNRKKKGQKKLKRIGQSEHKKPKKK